MQSPVLGSDEARTDALLLGIDGSRGMILTGYIDPVGNGVVATQSLQAGWQTKYALGDLASDLDKSSSAYVDMSGSFDAAIVQFIQGYYTPPKIGG